MELSFSNLWPVTASCRTDVVFRPKGMSIDQQGSLSFRDHDDGMAVSPGRLRAKGFTFWYQTSPDFPVSRAIL
jgi:hypothetical protein